MLKCHTEPKFIEPLKRLNDKIKYKHLDKITEAIKYKIINSYRNIQIQLLTLTSESWCRKLCC